MNKIDIFRNEEFGEIRTTIIDGEPWFVGKDVAQSLGYEKARNAIATHVDKDDALKWGVTDSLGRKQETTIINESGLYSLILSSKLDSAKRFKHWITSEVLPSIRKHDAYMTNEAIERTLTDPDYLIQLATALKKEREEKELEKNKRKLAEQTIEKQKPLVEFANQVSDTKDLIDMKTMAKLLKDENINIGRNRLFTFLRNHKILMDDNQPYQRYIDAGYFKVNEYTYKNSSGDPKTKRQTFVTGKGQVYIVNKVKKILS